MAGADSTIEGDDADGESEAANTEPGALGGAADETNGVDGDTAGVSLPVTVSGRRARVRLPADADATEAAAIATALGAHLHDRSVAARSAGPSDRGQERVDPWTLATRLKGVGKRRWPNDVRRGEEWSAAARSFD